jgi:DtxR family Mn-dependent transcriptional regulator
MVFFMHPLTSIRSDFVDKKYELSSSLYRYLGAIYKMEANALPARVKDLANAVGVRNGSVVGALKRLNEIGLIDYPPYRPVRLTEEGHKLAVHNLWRDRILKSFLMTVLHLSQAESVTAVNRLGYALEDKIVHRMRRFMAETYETNTTSFDVW